MESGHGRNCKVGWRLPVFLAAFLLLTIPALAGFSCGDEVLTIAPTTTGKTAPTVKKPATDTVSDSGPVMPNVDETQIAAVEAAASMAYNQDWGDGSGIRIVWGPNIIDDWALIGVENESGAAGKDVLVHREGGAWQVKDIGHALALNWQEQTPPGLWPSV